MKTMREILRADSSDDFDMQMIGKFLSFASRGDRVGLNQMLIQGISPDVQDYDNRTALHLAASEGHTPIVELLVCYRANVNLKDRWKRTPLTDARLYGHRDICRILEVNGGNDFTNDQLMVIEISHYNTDVISTLHDSFAASFAVQYWDLNRSRTVRHEEDSNDVKFDMSELNTEHSLTIRQGSFGESERVKWRGTWVVKTVVKRQICNPVKMILSAKDNTLLRELRHPNILQFLGSIVQQEEMVLITEYLPKGNLENILRQKARLDLPAAFRYALDIARGMNYLHEHKPCPIVHNHLGTRNLLQDEGGHLKIGEYWVQMLYEQINPDQNGKRSNPHNIENLIDDTKKDVRTFGFIFYQMLEGRHFMTSTNSDTINEEPVDFKPKFHLSRCTNRIHQLIEHCTSNNPSEIPSFGAVIEILEEESTSLGRAVCPC